MSMNQNKYRFTFEPHVSMAEAEMSLHLALFAVEGLHGEVNVRLEASYHCDEARRSITVDATTEVGIAIVKVFTRLLSREFGEEAFRVRPVGKAASHPVSESANGVPTDARAEAAV
jgi:hypothetical protein